MEGTNLRGLTRDLPMTLPALKGRLGKLPPNPEARREWDPSCFPSGRKEQRPGQTPNPKNRREEK
jgi:hypothetical protein